MQKDPERFPEIPSDLDSSIIRDVILASSQEIVPSDDEWEMLRRPLLGKGGYGEVLFRQFERDATDYSYGLKTVCIKVFPREEEPAEEKFLEESIPEELPNEENALEKRVSLQSHEGNAITFNDQLAGIEINLLHHERRGILTFILTDRTGEGEGINERLARQPDTFTASSIRLMFKDPSTRVIEGLASVYSEGEVFGYRFVPTSSAQLILLNIVDSILRSPRA